MPTWSISSTEVISNAAGITGGGIIVKGNDLRVEASIITSNTITESTSGGGFALQGGNFTLEHLTLAGNQGGMGCGICLLSGTAGITNTIIAGQQVGIYAEVGSQAYLDGTLWGSGEWANSQDWAGAGQVITGAVDLHSDPLFINPETLDYHIQPGSPAVDQGLGNVVKLDIDRQPIPNPLTGLPDIGADEYWELTPIQQVSILASEPIVAGVSAYFQRRRSSRRTPLRRWSITGCPCQTKVRGRQKPSTASPAPG